MAYTFNDLQTEVKFRGTFSQGGTEFDIPINNAINTSLFRISREALWRQLRRKDTFDTEAEQTAGTVSATNGSNSFTGSGLSLITNGVDVDRRISIQGSTLPYIIATITGENAFTTDRNYDGTTDTSRTYTIFGREEYNLPVQAGRVFLWHEQFGFPFVMRYIPDRRFYLSSVDLSTGDIPTHYRMWGENDIVDQPLAGSVMRISSSASADQSINVTIFGIVSSFPDFETIATDSSNGTTAVSGSKSFTRVERVVKEASTAGRITVDANTANVTIATLPVGDATGRILYKKVQFYPLPQDVFPVNVEFYKDPWRLINSGDMHELGHEFDEAIILLAVAKLKYINAQKEGDRWFSLYKDEVRSLRKVNSDKVDYFPVLDRPSQNVRRGGLLHPQIAFQQLGGFFGPTV